MLTDLLTSLDAQSKVNVNIGYGNKEKIQRTESTLLKWLMGDFDLGVFVEETSEKMMLVDNTGRL